MAFAECTWIVVHTWWPVSMNCITWRAASASRISETMPLAGWIRQKCISASLKWPARSSPSPEVGTAICTAPRYAVFDRVLDGHQIELAAELGHLQGEIGGERGRLAVARRAADEHTAMGRHADPGEQGGFGCRETETLQGHAGVEPVGIEHAREQVIAVPARGGRAGSAAPRCPPASGTWPPARIENPWNEPRR